MQSSPKQLQDIIHILDGFKGHAATIHRFSAEHLRDMGGYWSALKSLEIDPQIHALWLNITRQRVMISKTWVIRFLYEDCKTLVKCLSARHRAHIFRYNGHMSCDCIQSWETEHGDTSLWLAKLTLDLSGKLADHGNAYQWNVSSVTYLPVLDPPVRSSYQLETRRGRVPTNDAEFDWDVTWNVLQLIAVWLKISVENLKDLIRQSGLVHSIEQVLGKEALLLPAVWELYKSDPKWITERYRISKPYLMGGDVFSDFKDALRTCSAAKPSSTERSLLLQIQGVHEEFRKTSKTTVSHASRSQGVLSIAHQPIQVTSGCAINFLLAILRDALKSLSPAGKQSQQKQFQLIAADSDNFLALREQGASRRRILSCPENPFQDKNIVTKAGLFSALYFRARSFRSPALLQTPSQHLRTMFTGPEDVRQYESGIATLLQQSPELFGTLNATQRKYFFHHYKMYGQANPLPQDWPEKLWKAVELTDWEALTSEGAADFQTLHKLWTKTVRKGKKSTAEAPAELPSQYLPKMGALAIYLLCADLSYTCAVAKPSVDCLGNMVAGLKSGAVNGLQTLGLVPAELSGHEIKPHVQTQFVQLFQQLSGMLSQEEKDMMGFDGVVLEHTLCKVGRFLGEGAYGDWGFKKLMKKRKAVEVEDTSDQQDEDNDKGSSSRKKKRAVSRKGKEKATD